MRWRQERGTDGRGGEGGGGVAGREGRTHILTEKQNLVFSSACYVIKYFLEGEM